MRIEASAASDAQRRLRPAVDELDAVLEDSAYLVGSSSSPADPASSG
jgi:hypothetical protein